MDRADVFLVGRLTRDPKFFGDGDKQRAIFTIASNKGSGSNRKASFFDCIAWGKRADIMRDFNKGTGIFITGELEQDSYENKEGVKVNRVQVNVGSITATTSTRRDDNSGDDDVRVGETDEASIPF